MGKKSVSNGLLVFSWRKHGLTSCCSLTPFFLQLLSILLSSILYGPPMTTGQYGGTVSDACTTVEQQLHSRCSVHYNEFWH